MQLFLSAARIIWYEINNRTQLYLQFNIKLNLHLPKRFYPIQTNVRIYLYSWLLVCLFAFRHFNYHWYYITYSRNRNGNLICVVVYKYIVVAVYNTYYVYYIQLWSKSYMYGPLYYLKFHIFKLFVSILISKESEDYFKTDWWQVTLTSRKTESLFSHLLKILLTF